MKDFLLAVWRNAYRERRYAVINLVGLALGFASCLMLALFLRSELTYDLHNVNHARIFRIAGEFTNGGVSTRAAWVPRAMAPLIAADYPQVQAYVRFTDASLQDGLRLHHGDRVHNWRRTYFADEKVFEVFTHKILAGDPKSALLPEQTVAISETMARTYFGERNPLGEILRTDSGQPWRVTLVFADLPANAHLQYDCLFSYRIPLLKDAPDRSGLRQQLRTGFSAMTYLLMAPGFHPADWPRINDDFVTRYFQDGTGTRAQPNLNIRTWLQPLADIHYGEPLAGDQPTGNRIYLYGCVAVAIFILIVACINYTNLATARALRRARSTGIRKILGAGRARLLLEILGEAVLFSLAAAAVGVALAEVALTLTPIGELLGAGVQVDLSAEPSLLGWVLGAAVAVGLVAGLYPALYLSSWMPVAAITSRGGGAASGARLREGLVLLQLVIAVGAVAATLVMASQMRYVSTLPLGFNRENQVMVTIRGTDNFLRIPAMAQELRRDPQVLSVTQAGAPPGTLRGMGLLPVEDAKGEVKPTRVGVIEVAAGFVPAMGIELIAGQNFPADAQARAGTQFLVNETFVRTMGWAEPIGRRILNGRVIGVVRDFHFQSLREPIAPLALVALSDDPSREAEARRPFLQRMVLIRVSGEDLPGTLKHIGEVVTRFDPGNPFEYTLLDDTLGSLYATERRMLSLIAIFATLCIFIACLGLYGLTAFATERRAREIAMRKVLGASAWQVVLLLARRILLLTAIGGLIAAVASWRVMDEWLAGFAYRVKVDPLILILSILLAAAVALGTVALQSFRTARADPGETLRYE